MMFSDPELISCIIHVLSQYQQIFLLMVDIIKKVLSMVQQTFPFGTFFNLVVLLMRFEFVCGSTLAYVLHL